MAEELQREDAAQAENPGQKEPVGERYIIISEEDFDRKLKAAGRAGAKEGVAAYKREVEEHQKELAEKVRSSAKTIIMHYRDLKKMRKTSVNDVDSVADPTLKEILEGIAGMVRRDEFRLTSTTRNTIVTGMLMDHVDVQLKNYKSECKRARTPDFARRYRVVEMMYLREEPMKVEEVAEIEGIESRTVYMTLEKAYDDLAILIFGVDGLMCVENRRVERNRKRKTKKDSVAKSVH